MHEVKVQALAKGVRGLVALRRGLRSHEHERGLTGSRCIHVDELRRVLIACHITITDRVSTICL